MISALEQLVHDEGIQVDCPERPRSPLPRHGGSRSCLCSHLLVPTLTLGLLFTLGLMLLIAILLELVPALDLVPALECNGSP